MRKITLLILCVSIILTATASFADVNGPYRDGYIEGFIKGLADRQIQIEEYDGTVHTIAIEPNADLRIDNIPVGLNTFKIGMEVYGELSGRQIKYLESYSTENPGYIPPGTKIRSGVIKSIDRNQLILRSPMGKEERYFTSFATVALKRGRNVSLSTLYEGDRVRLYFDEIGTDVISRMEIEGDSILIKDLYRGKLEISDRTADAIVVEDVEVLRNNKWEKVKDSMRLSYSSDIPVFVGGQRIPHKNLKHYKGRTIYMALKDHFGKDRIEKMVIKTQYETMISDKIKAINWFANSFETGNLKNIGFHDGTMIIKNGRLVERQSINVNSDAMIIAQGRGSALTADIIRIYNENLNNSNIGQNFLYTGRLDTILMDRVFLKDYFLLQENEWRSYRTYSDSDQKELFYNHDTDIYDLENMRIVSPEEFYAKAYAVDEDSDYVRDNNLKDWVGYIFTDADTILGMVVQKNTDSLLAQRITIGEVHGVENDPLVGWTINVKDSKDWSSRNQKWMPKSVNMRLNIEKSMIIKDGELITQDELRAGDRLYIVRNDFLCKVVIVK